MILPAEVNHLGVAVIGTAALLALLLRARRTHRESALDPAPRPAGSALVGSLVLGLLYGALAGAVAALIYGPDLMVPLFALGFFLVELVRGVAGEIGAARARRSGPKGAGAPGRAAD